MYSEIDSLDSPHPSTGFWKRDAQAGTKMGGVDYKLSRVSCVQTDAEALPILGYTLQYMNACTQDGCTCLPLKF